MNRNDICALKTYCGRYECYNKSINAPFPADPLSEIEIVDTLYVIAKDLIKRDETLKKIMRQVKEDDNENI